MGKSEKSSWQWEGHSWREGHRSATLTFRIVTLTHAHWCGDLVGEASEVATLDPPHALLSPQMKIRTYIITHLIGPFSDFLCIQTAHKASTLDQWSIH